MNSNGAVKNKLRQRRYLREGTLCRAYIKAKLPQVFKMIQARVKEEQARRNENAQS